MQDFKKEILGNRSVEDIFTWIHQHQHWKGDGASVSGLGSTLRYTENLRKELPALLKRFSVKSIFDVPCGDFHWMRELLPQLDVGYLGGDIVKPMIDSLNKEFATGRVAFIHFDLIKDQFPEYELVLCRDCLPHLSYADTKSFLTTFARNNVPYLLTTTHVPSDDFRNTDIQTGDFRMIDLFAAPYNFPAPLATIEDWIPPFPERQICLWSNEQVREALFLWREKYER